MIDINDVEYLFKSQPGCDASRIDKNIWYDWFHSPSGAFGQCKKEENGNANAGEALSGIVWHQEPLGWDGENYNEYLILEYISKVKKDPK